VVEDIDVIVISMKPQIVKQVLLELRPQLSEEKLLVSIAVSTKMQDLQMLAGRRSSSSKLAQKWVWLVNFFRWLEDSSSAIASNCIQGSMQIVIDSCCAAFAE
ncbi:hypothetical protein ACJX0J_041692, partial [Zea mays]